MKYLFIASVLFMVGCNHQPGDFEKYVSQLEPLRTPIVLKTIEYPERKGIESYDTSLFQTYKLSEAQAAYGKIYDDESETELSISLQQT